MKTKKQTHCNNPSCLKELVHTEGRRPKKYCSDKCRISHHLSIKKKPKYVQRKTYEALEEKLKSLMYGNKTELQKVRDDLAEVGVAAYETKENGQVERIDPMSEKAQILSKIAAIRSEKLPCHITTPLGKKSWEFDQKKKIAELQKQLNPPI